MAHILIMGMNYIPEKTASGPVTADMCEDLVARGHRVTMVTGFPHYPEWCVYDGYRGKLFTHEMLNGVSVRRGFVYVPEKPNPLRRVLYDCSIALSAGLNLFGCSRPAVLMVISPPLQLAVTALGIGKLWKVPVLLVIKDIIPDLAIDLGMLKHPLIIHLAQTLERLCYRQADQIVVIGQGFVDNLIAKQVPAKKLSLIPNWANTDVIRPKERMSRFRRKHNIDADTFVILYGGNMSVKQGLENVVLAAEKMQDQTNVQFFLIGQGAAAESLREMVRERGLSSIKFLPFEPEEMLSDMFAAADVLLINHRASVRDSVLPGKLLNYMAAGRPVVAAVHADSETAVYLRKANCGRVVPPEQPSALATAIRQLCDDSELRKRLGEGGRQFAEANFARRQVLDRYVDLIENLARNHSGNTLFEKR